MKKIHKIVCCCGNGLGSSLIVSMNLEKILEELNISDVEVGHTSLSDFSESSADLFLIGMDLKQVFLRMPRVIVLQNIVSKEELKQKIRQAFNQTDERYWIQ